MKFFYKWMFLWFVVFGIIAVHADEGMWLPHQMKDLNLEKSGLRMDPADLYKTDGTGLMSAIVSFGGGTGEFVSPQGLILTNHHVAFRALQRASDPQHDYITDGFLAQTSAEEIPAPGYHIDVLLEYRDVTKDIAAAVREGMDPLQRYDAIDKAKKKLVGKTEKKGTDIRAEVKDMYQGNKYYLFIYKRINDIRIVYAPPRDLGNFGGEIDNWMWPRHTADFSFLRAYVSKDNRGVGYSTNNVPYHPQSVLKISLDGVKEGDFTFVMGYPARTYRNFTLSELEYDLKDMKERLINYSDLISFFEDAGKNSKAVEIKYASKVKGLNNSKKNRQGKLEGFAKHGMLKRKALTEKQFQEWADADPVRVKKYGGILERIGKFMQDYDKQTSREQKLSALVSPYLGPALLWQAHLIYRTVEERQKPDLKREEDYQERNMPEIRQRVELAERGYDLNTDRAFMKYLLVKMFDYPQEQVPDALKDIIAQKSETAVSDFVDGLYEKTILADPQRRLQLLNMKPKELNKLHDPFIDLAGRIESQLKTMREQGKALDQQRSDLRKIYLEALLEQKNSLLAPDANSTLRFTCGTVAGYSPADGIWYEPQTTLNGVLEKDTGTFPFRVPEKIKELEKARDFGRYADSRLNDIPACFLNTTNVTGGNSGSPTLNAKGEQVGIIFDMTYESVIGDYYIIPKLQRTISVDIRYVLFVTEKFSGAARLLEEMGLQGK
ncbi:MAG: S46 family peptidase [Calditrichia bacterium]